MERYSMTLSQKIGDKNKESLWKRNNKLKKSKSNRLYNIYVKMMYRGYSVYLLNKYETIKRKLRKEFNDSGKKKR